MRHLVLWVLFVKFHNIYVSNSYLLNKFFVTGTVLFYARLFRLENRKICKKLKIEAMTR